jgi:hypothetical protein
LVQEFVQEKIEVDMRGTIIFVLIFFVSFFSVNAQQKNNALAETRWKFVGLLFSSSDTLRPCPGDVLYTIDFKSNNKLTGLATVQYKGKYKIKKDNFIRIRVFISKATLPGKNDSGEFECRLNYSKYLGMGGNLFIQGDRLKIVSNEYVTMVFESVK